jgi:tripartite-type tricarboxylate transporter receptor subunit TctC
MPEVPTMDEAGLKGYEVSNWNGIWAPAKTPRDTVQRLNREIAKAMQAPELKERVAALGNTIVADTQEDFSAYIRKESDKWARLVKEAGMKID